MSTSIHDILDEFRDDARHNRDLGDRFESLVRAFLTKDPVYADLFSDVWLWMEWPDRKGKGDTGIDIVAQERATGDNWAIQCKFFDPDHMLQKGDIDSFFTASGKRQFSHRMIVSTTDRWSRNAEDALDAQKTPVVRLGIKDLVDSAIDWSEFSVARPRVVKLKPKKKLREHQTEALANIVKGFKTSDRGKLIMACGTGKTFTALKLAEKIVPKGGSVLFLMPSISLISQTVTEWANEAKKPLHCFAVCSDPKAGRGSDTEDISTRDLALPAHTDARKLARQYQGMKSVAADGISVVFSTYHSIAVVAKAQKHGLPDFDLIICDEAHRTTGVELNEGEATAFVKVHDAKFIKATKRLYMTGTSRIYDDVSKGKAKEAEIKIYSMDDEEIYGPEFHRLDFSEAVRRDLLADYKVMVLAVDEKHVSKAFQHQLADSDHELRLEDAVKIVGCWNGLSKRLVRVEGDATETIDPDPMRRAVAFSRTIKDSKSVTALFAQIIDKYQSNNDPGDREDFLRCEVEHVDGTMGALKRNAKLRWLKEETTAEGNQCRVLSNVRCLSEGVDVPALDAVLFLNPRKSVVDVVQSVGRVMRKAPGKQFGYIILPIGIPADMAPEEALADNQKYKVVWQVLQALRAHDDRFNAIINQIDLNDKRPDKIQIIGVSGGEDDGNDDSGTGSKDATTSQLDLSFPELDNWKDAIFAKIVIKCGDRRYWETWAKDVAEIAQHHITRIKALLEDSNVDYRKRFEEFLEGLRAILNPSITEDDAIEMLSQHLITKPVFDALFQGYEFTKKNPVSVTMQKMLDLLEKQGLEKETESLEKFYASVRERASGIDNAEGKQKIVVELYDKFFKTAFPRMANRLGIVYTPIEIVDFIIRSADDALRKEFGVGLTDKNVHVLDPFTGTGTFIVRLLQSGLIDPKDLARKYHDELHANEIILLAYYIAAVNIEAAYHGLAGDEYAPFDGIVLTDTFQMTEPKGTLNERMFPENNQRVVRQNKRDIRVIVSNPPYSVGQSSANDPNERLDYPRLDERIRESYVARSSAKLQRNLYDSYVRAIRWASDRIHDRGIICYVTNGSFLDSNSMDGLRACLIDGFTSIYCFNLRGNARTSGEARRREKGNVFGGGTKTPVTITLLVKNPEHKSEGTVQYFDIGDYLTREQKLAIIAEAGGVNGIRWDSILPNKQHDWLNQRDPAFKQFVPIASKDKSEPTAIFSLSSPGISTSRDAWAYSFSAKKLAKTMSAMIAFYNEQVGRYREERARSKNRSISPDDVVNSDPTRISWSAKLKAKVEKQVSGKYAKRNIRSTFYRPFTRQHLYLDGQFTERPGKTSSIQPDGESENRIIAATGPAAGGKFSALMTNAMPNFHFQDTGQCFPLRVYDDDDASERLRFGDGGWHLNISDRSRKEFQKTYGDKGIGKEDLFYYVYGILHSPEYKRRFAADLKKMLPRIPMAGDFWAFSRAGRKLADLHLNYEDAEPYPVEQHCDVLALDPQSLYKVQKMVFGRRDRKPDKTTIIYNSHIKLSGVPLEAYEYEVNGKPAIEWIMERYQISKDQASGIMNDPNDWSMEHDDPEYILRLLKSIITVSLETTTIVKALPRLKER